MGVNKWILIWTIATFSLHVIPTINPSSNTAHGTLQRGLNGYWREGRGKESAGAGNRDINLLEKEDEHPLKLIHGYDELVGGVSRNIKKCPNVYLSICIIMPLFISALFLKLIN